MNYRREIDGLRALAVLPVILFHAGFETFSGGFVGVDVFFVISGYLITLILIEELKNNRFSFTNFYVRRVRRILPALLLVLSVTYLISSLINLPLNHKEVGQYVVASIFGISNILLFLKGRDYFGLEQGSNPLFITWSLGVEEQFYFIFPLFLFVIWRFGENKIFWLLVSLVGLSLALSEFGWRTNQAANFFLAPTRAWELLSGCLAAFMAEKKGLGKSEILSLAGLFAIIFPVFTYDSSTPFPSFYAVVPVLGTALVILFGDRNTFVGRLLGFKVFVGVGLVSYSTYLWHLPIKVYVDYFIEGYIYSYFLYFLLLLVFSYLSYRLVEIPFRRHLSNKVALPIIFLASLVLAMVGVLGHLNGGYPQRNDLFKTLRSNNGLGLSCNGNTKIVDSCSNSSYPQLAVLGNSYAMTWVSSFVENSSLSVVQLTQDSCAIGFVDKVDDVNSIPCDQFYERAIETIINSPSIKYVLISSPFNKEVSNTLYEDSFLKLIGRLSNKSVLVVGPTPSAPFNVGDCVVKNSLFSRNSSCDFSVPEDHFKKVERLYVILSKIPNVKFIDITDIICPSRICLMSRNGIDSVYTDMGHLSFGGANFVFDELNLDLK
jgi:peptidoglycan/LPS O-acetylase OafA/YrhL